MPITKYPDGGLHFRGHPAGDAAGMLSDDDLEIARHVVLGMSNRQVGARLNLTEAVVKRRLARMCKKLRLANRTHLAVWVARQGLRAGDALH